MEITNNPEAEFIKDSIAEALTRKKYYFPHSPFYHPPEFSPCQDARYACIVDIHRWNTRSSRMTRLWARFDKKRQEWVFARKPGFRPTKHGENLR